MHRCRLRKDEFAGRRVELAIRNAKGVTRENRLCLPINNAIVVQSMPRRMDQLELATPECDAHAILALQDALARNRRDLPVKCPEAGFTVDGNAAFNQFRRVDEMTGAARMDHGLRVG